MLIVFSGVDSSGKSTQISKIFEYYSKTNSRFVIKWSRGGYTPGINFLKSLVRRFSRNVIPAQGHSSERTAAFKKPAVSRLWLFISILDLIIYYGVWFRILSLKYSLIADRYIWDTLIDFKINFPNIDFQKWLLWRILLLVYMKPEKSLILTIDPETSILRSIKKQEPFMEDVEIRKKRIVLYEELFRNGNWQRVIDGDRPEDAINKEIVKFIGQVR